MFWEVLVDKQIGVALFPVAEKDGADWAVQSTGEECEQGTRRVGRWWGDNFGRKHATSKDNLWKGYVLSRIETFGRVGIAQYSD